MKQEDPTKNMLKSLDVTPEEFKYFERLAQSSVTTVNN